MQVHTFDELRLAPAIQRALQAERYERPTEIQAAAIPHLLAGRDLIGCAQTGTGKTAAFALPILHRLASTPKRAPKRGARVLVLTPTRELAAQVCKSFQTYGRNLKLHHAMVFGGVGQGPQVKALSRGLDVLVATPGRLLDLIEQGHARLSDIEVFVLDEADRMLDMGFLPDIRKVIAMLPKQRQTLLFSATMSAEIRKLAEGMLQEPAQVSVAPQELTVERIEERVLFVDEEHKRALLSNLLKAPEIRRALVFTRTKHGANRLVKQLGQEAIRADAIHGNKSQTARMAALESFRRGRCRVLVATDIAARGIDVDDVTHVVNFDLPNESESYVHRIGRTARAGAAGTAISFCSAAERAYLRDIERLLKRPVPVETDHPFHSIIAAEARGAAPNMGKRFGKGNRRFGGNSKKPFRHAKRRMSRAS